MITKKIKSAGCALLATVMLLTTLAGCGGDGDIPPLTTLPTGTSAPTQTSGNPTQSSNEGNDPAAPEKVNFTLDQLKQAQIVIPANSMVIDEKDGYVYSAVADLKKTILNRYDYDIPVVEDTAPQTKYEILIGDTNRAESYELFDELLVHDYAYALCSDKIVVRGGDPESLREAIVTFHARVSSYQVAVTGIFYSSNMDTLIEGNYLAKDTQLNGVPLAEYGIVYPAESNLYEKELAERLANRLQVLTGRSFDFYPDSTPYREGSHEFLIGKTNRDFTATATGGAAVECQSNFVALVGSTAYDYGVAEKVLLGTILEPQIANEVSNITLPATTDAPPTAAVSLMGYNIYGVTAYLYQERADNICRLVTKYLPDIVAFQEPAENMMCMIHMEDYYGYYLGIPRHGADVPALSAGWPGANSYGAILYAKDRYEVVEGGTKWMTSTPDEVSKLDQSDYYRIYTYVLFRDKVTSEEFIVVNHHLDFKEEVQVLSMKYMFEFFNKTYTEIPVIMAGDFNAQISTVVIKDLIASDIGGFSFANRVATTIDDNVTGAEIDFIFVTACCVSVRKFTMCRDTYPDRVCAVFDHAMPSDHPATYAELVIDSKKVCTHDWTDAKNFNYQPSTG